MDIDTKFSSWCAIELDYGKMSIFWSQRDPCVAYLVYFKLPKGENFKPIYEFSHRTPIFDKSKEKKL